MPYKVLNEFIDIKQKNTLYREGDTYPKVGFKEDPKRVAYLQTDENKYKKVFLGQEIKAESEQEGQNTNPSDEESPSGDGDHSKEKTPKASKSKKTDSKE